MHLIRTDTAIPGLDFVFAGLAGECLASSSLHGLISYRYLPLPALRWAACSLQRAGKELKGVSFQELMESKTFSEVITSNMSDTAKCEKSTRGKSITSSQVRGSNVFLFFNFKPAKKLEEYLEHPYIFT